MNNFYGEIKKVNIKVKDEKGKEIVIGIYQDRYIKINYDGISKGDKISCGGKILSHKYEDSNNKYFEVKPINFNKLRHFGDINSFIPLYKIINYIINEEENSKENNTNKEEKISKLKNALANVSKILRITVKLLFFSSPNLKDFFLKSYIFH